MAKSHSRTLTEALSLSCPASASAVFLAAPAQAAFLGARGGHSVNRLLLVAGSPSLRSLSSRPATGLTSCPEDASDNIPTGERGSWSGFGGSSCTAVRCPHPCLSVLLSHVSTTAPQRKTCDGFQTNTRDLSSSWMQPQSRQASKVRLF